ncbi:MAG TPA: hypothetical protein VGX27_09985 [Candidatus Dormibacteraeota bacterium]|nr:hypothetical protein [Candidatus Dormibacteraeota bacterium]
MTPDIANFLSSNAALGKGHPLKVIVVSLAIASVLPAIFTVVVLLQGRPVMPGLPIVWIPFWVIGALLAFLAIDDAARQDRDLARGVFVRWTGPFKVLPVRFTVQVVVDHRRLQTVLAPPLQTIKSGEGTVDYLPVSGMLLAVRDASGRVIWSRLTAHPYSDG